MFIQAQLPDVRIRLIRTAVRSAVVAVFFLVLNACSDANSQSAPSTPPPPPVRVDTIELTPVSDSAVFTGEFRAINTVNLRPRVNGYIDNVFFEEGSLVNKGDLLFQIDPRPFQIALNRAQATVISTKAEYNLAVTELKRSEKLLATNAISQEIHDQNATRVQITKANHQEAQAFHDESQLNLDYTRIIAPISGKTSRAFITEGNFVNSGTTVLTTIVSRNPMYVVFDADEKSYINYVSELENSASQNTSIQVGLSGASQFPFNADLNFVDNQVNPESGTIRIRATVENDRGLFLPGMVARVKMQISDQYKAVLIDDSAIATDQSKKYVLIVNEQNTTEYRPVELGGLYNGKRIIKSGLTVGDAVVIGGGLKIRPGMAVSPQKITEQATDSLVKNTAQL